MSSYELEETKAAREGMVTTSNDYEADIDNDSLARRQLRQAQESRQASLNDENVIARFGKKQQLKVQYYANIYKMWPRP
jgi:hypothetical protein